MIFQMIHPFLLARRHTTVLKGFVKKELFGRYAGSYAGVFWIVLEPLANIAVFHFIFSYVFRVRFDAAVSGTDSFTVYFLCAYFPWLIFSDAVVRSAGSVVGNAGLVTKVIFPVELLPLSSVLTPFLTHGAGFFLYLLYLVAKGYAGPVWLYMPLIVATHFVLCCGMAFLLSALVVFVRDILQSLGILMMVWFYASPVLYPLSFVPEPIRSWLWANPMTYALTCFRDVLLNGSFHWPIFALFAMNATVLYGFGSWFFTKSKRAFADVL